MWVIDEFTSCAFIIQKFQMNRYFTSRSLKAFTGRNCQLHSHINKAIKTILLSLISQRNSSFRLKFLVSSLHKVTLIIDTLFQFWLYLFFL